MDTGLLSSTHISVVATWLNQQNHPWLDEPLASLSPSLSVILSLFAATGLT